MRFSSSPLSFALPLHSRCSLLFLFRFDYQKALGLAASLVFNYFFNSNAQHILMQCLFLYPSPLRCFDFSICGLSPRSPNERTLYASSFICLSRRFSSLAPMLSSFIHRCPFRRWDNLITAFDSWFFLFAFSLPIKFSIYVHPSLSPFKSIFPSFRCSPSTRSSRAH